MKCHWTMNLRISSKWWWREAYTQNASSKDAQEKRKTYIFSIDLTTQIFLRYYFFRVKKHNMFCLICKYNRIKNVVWSKEKINLILDRFYSFNCFVQQQRDLRFYIWKRKPDFSSYTYFPNRYLIFSVEFSFHIRLHA